MMAKAPPWIKNPPNVEPEPQPAIKMIVEQVRIKPIFDPPKEEIKIAEKPAPEPVKIATEQPVKPEPAVPVMEAKPFRWRHTMRVLFARLKYWAWQIIAKGVLGLIYIAV